MVKKNLQLATGRKLLAVRRLPQFRVTVSTLPNPRQASLNSSSSD